MLPNSEPYLTSMIERFRKVVKGFYPFIIFAKCSNLDVWQGSKHISGPCLDSSIRTVYVCMYLHMNNEYRLCISKNDCQQTISQLTIKMKKDKKKEKVFFNFKMSRQVFFTKHVITPELNMVPTWNMDQKNWYHDGNPL